PRVPPDASEERSHPALLGYASLGRCVGERQAYLDCPIKDTGVSIRSLLRLALPRHLRRFNGRKFLEGLNKMKYSRFPLALMLALTLTAVGMPFISGGAAASQGQSTALERGYRTGYSDGYNAGFRDVTENRASNYQNNVEYQRADRSYNQVWGPLEDYRDGYQQGFEAGYASGYEKRTFDSTLPTGFKKRGSVQVTATAAGTPDSTADTT